MSVLAQWKKAWAMLQVRQLRVGAWSCPLCRGLIHLRLAADETAVRCIRCGASAITQSIAKVIGDEYPSLGSLAVCELSSRGTLVEWLSKHAGSLTTSEYVAGGVPGEFYDGVRCENVEHLTYADASFDLCTSTEVFEHVRDDAAGFGEIRRVLKPGGKCIFTVPMSEKRETVERVRVDGAVLTHLLPPEYHRDPFRMHGQVLCMRNYGYDIADRLLHAGFSSARIVHTHARMMGYARPVILATR
ncbi:MAG TPA: SAM-dependent methyltransferase [Xanthomonadaceae bacterium]|nr:SAM-dependent methyltransferase [Xanthomonadaceae bacterium]